MKGRLGQQGKRWQGPARVAAVVTMAGMLLAMASTPGYGQAARVEEERIDVAFDEEGLRFTVVAAATILNVWVKVCVYGEVRSDLFKIDEIFDGGSTNVFEYTDTEVVTDVWVKTGTTDEGGPGVHYPNENVACPGPEGETPPECDGPEEVDATNDDHTVVVDWTAVANASAYRVYRAFDEGAFFFLAEEEAPRTHHVDDTVDGNTTYRYTVSAIVGGEETDACAVAEVTSNAQSHVPPCDGPENLSARERDHGIELGWDAVGNASEYRVYRALGDGPFVQIANVTGTGFNDMHVEDDTTYRYQVTAVVSGEESTSCSTVAITTREGEGGGEEGTCAGPKAVQAMTSGEGIWVTWSSVDGATAYGVYRATGGGGLVRIATVGPDENEYRDDMVDPGVTYRYQVTAMVDGPETEACSTAEATAIPDFPTITTGLIASLVGLATYLRSRRLR